MCKRLLGEIIILQLAKMGGIFLFMTFKGPVVHNKNEKWGPKQCPF